MSQYRILYITCENDEQARSIGKELVTKKLAACVNILGKVTSIYEWEGELKEAGEVAMIAKTHESKAKAAIDEVVKLHSYECPCVVSLPVDGGYAEFLAWISESVKA